MSHNDTADDGEEIDATDTDWLANSDRGYGFGYTKEQALTAMAVHANYTEGPVTVSLIEHVGGATVSAGGARVDTLVTAETAEIPLDEYRELRDAAIAVDVAADVALGEADIEADDE